MRSHEQHTYETSSDDSQACIVGAVMPSPLRAVERTQRATMHHAFERVFLLASVTMQLRERAFITTGAFYMVFCLVTYECLVQFYRQGFLAAVCTIEGSIGACVAIRAASTCISSLLPCSFTSVMM